MIFYDIKRRRCRFNNIMLPSSESQVIQYILEYWLIVIPNEIVQDCLMNHMQLH